VRPKKGRPRIYCIGGRNRPRVALAAMLRYKRTGSGVIMSPDSRVLGLGGWRFRPLAPDLREADFSSDRCE
jgi:hypothetical protein